jgi:ribosomal protein S18 acetylase RimI-like enzyme
MQALLFNNPEFSEKGAFGAYENGKLIGFGCGFVRRSEMDKPEVPANLNSILVKKEYRNRGVGKALLDNVENYFRSFDKKAARFVFLDPVNWPWYIPNTDKDDHPGCPAMPINTPEYFFLLHNGYGVQGIIDAFHLPLSEYHLPAAVVEKVKENEAKGIKIELYEEGRHYGLEEFYQNIQNPGFESAIRSNLKLEKPRPFFVVSQDNKVVGWTGAMWTETSGRAHFDGIVVDPAIRGGGVGKSLFCTLCQYSKEHGSKFMTFFTGLDNPARNIYLYAGFKIIQTFAIMKKGLE